jgi:hypothetical protein
MVKLKISTKEPTQVSYFGFFGYVFSKIINSIDSISSIINKVETLSVSDRIQKNWNNFNYLKEQIELDKPIYITGLARSGTTILLEMLAKHPNLASHKYKHLVLPYLPYWFDLMLNRLQISTEPFERFHQDRIIIDQNSPEAVEEMLWQKFFSNLHNEERSNILTANLNYPQFEIFYRNHIQKLLIGQKATRYLAKNNYNLTRLEYLLNVFPRARFLVMIRDPLSQIASLIKQHNLFMKMERKNPYIIDWLKLLGHHEFGVGLKCINTGNTARIKEIKALMHKKGTNIKAWAYYWDSLYNYLANLLERNQKVKDATLVIRYTDLCENSDKTIDDILHHTELPLKDFIHTKRNYCEYLRKPDYYSFDFSEEEEAQIIDITADTAKRFEITMNFL